MKLPVVHRWSLGPLLLLSLGVLGAGGCGVEEPTSADGGAPDRDGARPDRTPQGEADARFADRGAGGGPAHDARDGREHDVAETDDFRPERDAPHDPRLDTETAEDATRDLVSVDVAAVDVVDADASKMDVAPPTTAAAPVAVYWGQNGYGGAHPGDKSKYEKSLGDLCSDDHVGLVLLSFMTSFVSPRNGGLPELNFAFHCETAYDAAHPFLLRCPEIETAISACQARGIRVVLSLGGAAGAYGFSSDAEGETFAQTTWDMFLGGQGTVRPFGAAVLDGVDLDIEGGSTTGYSAFVRRTRALMNASAAKRFLITAAPQCVFPDAYLGPAAGKPLGDVPEAFDYLLVQFYNNFCHFGNRAEYDAAFASWAGVGKTGRPRLLVGLPASAEAGGGFVSRADVQVLVSSAAGTPTYAGISLWDVSYDQNNVENGQTYSTWVGSILKNAGIHW